MSFLNQSEMCLTGMCLVTRSVSTLLISSDSGIPGSLLLAGAQLGDDMLSVHRVFNDQIPFECQKGDRQRVKLVEAVDSVLAFLRSQHKRVRYCDQNGESLPRIAEHAAMIPKNEITLASFAFGTHLAFRLYDGCSTEQQFLKFILRGEPRDGIGIIDEIDVFGRLCNHMLLQQSCANEAGQAEIVRKGLIACRALPYKHSPHAHEAELASFAATEDQLRALRRKFEKRS